VTPDRTETTALLRRAKGGDAASLDELYRRCGGKLLALIRLRLGKRLRASMESRDVLQACLLKSFQRLDELEAADGPGLMAWLARIAENEIRDQADFVGRQRRDAARTVELDEGTVELASRLRSALSQAILGEEQQALEAALELLSDEHREVIVLRKYEELSFAEIGRRMGRSEDACRMLLARALTALTLAMSEHA
jgi:RNA polymerase sigma-70 factor (ECF subfamily)